MNFVIEKTVLENILQNLQPFLEKKDTSQITSHIYLSADTNKLYAKATDYEIGLSIETTSIEVIENGSITANGKKLLDIVRILKDEKVELKFEKDNLFIKQKKSNFKLPTFKSSEYPAFVNIEDKSNISIDTHLLIDSLRKITPAADTNNPKFSLNGTLIDIKESNINFVATDTRRLALVSFETTNESELSIIIPKKAIIEMQKLFNENSKIYYDNTYLIVESETSIFFTKLINDKYPDYNRIIPKDTSKNIELSKSSITSALKQISTISQDIKITIDSNSILFESLSDDNIEAKTSIEIENGLTQPFILAFNSKYMLDFLSHISTDNFTLHANESNQPFFLQDSNFKTIIMPIVI